MNLNPNIGCHLKWLNDHVIVKGFKFFMFFPSHQRIFFKKSHKIKPRGDHFQ